MTDNYIPKNSAPKEGDDAVISCIKKKMRERHYKHAEAFKLMLYSNKYEMEILWNSRDGVTPFLIPDRKNACTLEHTNWNLDLYTPKYNPPLGMRIFVDATEELLQPSLLEYVHKYFDNSDYKTPSDMYNKLLEDWLERVGTPFILTVDQKWLDERAKENKSKNQ